MSGYTIISDVTDTIVRILREGMVPDIIPNFEEIGACCPSERGDISLVIKLCDIRRNHGVVKPDRVAVGADKMRAPSVYLDLFYMITAFSPSDIKFRAVEECKMIGRAIQLLESNVLLKSELLGRASAGLQFPPKMELLDLDSEEKLRLWNISDMPYRLSLFYKVYPIEIESLRISDVTRVKSTKYDFGEKAADGDFIKED